jgi:hypothetical protein
MMTAMLRAESNKAPFALFRYMATIVIFIDPFQISKEGPLVSLLLTRFDGQDNGRRLSNM